MDYFAALWRLHACQTATPPHVCLWCLNPEAAGVDVAALQKDVRLLCSERPGEWPRPARAPYDPTRVWVTYRLRLRVVEFIRRRRAKRGRPRIHFPVPEHKEVKEPPLSVGEWRRSGRRINEKTPSCRGCTCS